MKDLRIKGDPRTIVSIEGTDQTFDVFPCDNIVMTEEGEKHLNGVAWKPFDIVTHAKCNVHAAIYCAVNRLDENREEAKIKYENMIHRVIYG